MPRSVRTESATRSSNGLSLACISATGQDSLRPTSPLPSRVGSIAISHSEQVASSPVSVRGATIV